MNRRNRPHRIQRPLPLFAEGASFIMPADAAERNGPIETVYRIPYAAGKFILAAKGHVSCPLFLRIKGQKQPDIFEQSGEVRFKEPKGKTIAHLVAFAVYRIAFPMAAGTVLFHVMTVAARSVIACKGVLNVAGRLFDRLLCLSTLLKYMRRIRAFSRRYRRA